ncbi:MAG: sucrose-phosphate phosphatase [Cyanobacteria bacterium P01_A01_bin.80]
MSKFMFVTDLDNTFVGDDDALVKLSKALTKHREEYGSKIVYATGRSRFLYQELKEEKQLIDPDALVVAVGTEIYLDEKQQPDVHWSEKLSHEWDKELVLSKTAEFSELVMQPSSEQGAFKVSFHIEEATAAKVLPLLDSALSATGLNTKLIYSSGIDLDIVPRRSDKGQAMQFLGQKWNIPATRTVACGDSGNDIALFAVGDERGVIVGNARPELLEWHNQNPAEYHYLAKKYCAGGILEGLKHFGFLA